MTAKRILVPLDGSESAEAAAAIAADLVRASGGGVRLLRVRPVPKVQMSDHGRVIAFADQEMDRLTAEGHDYLESVKAQFPDAPVESVVRFGEPVEEILVEAEASGADAIVLATGNPSWLERVTGADVGQTILRKAKVPVVLVRAA